MEAGLQNPFSTSGSVQNASIGYNGITPLNQGWSCPKCGSAHAPHVQTCPQSWGLSSPLTGTYSPPIQPYVVTCGQGQVGFQNMQQNVHPLASQGYISGSGSAKP